MLSKLFKPKLVNRWLLTIAGINGIKSPELLEWGDECWEMLKACYNQPHRHYHNFDHIRDLLRKSDVVHVCFEDTTAVELAIWFHDSIYDPLSKFNEDASAQLAHSCIMKLGDEYKQLADKVSELIMFTKWSADTFKIESLDELKEHYPNASMDYFYLRDMDWSGFGSKWSTFDNNNKNIRYEYSFICDYDYYTNRLKFLEMINSLERPLYSTTWYDERIGDIAKYNILKEIKIVKCLLKI